MISEVSDTFPVPFDRGSKFSLSMFSQKSGIPSGIHAQRLGIPRFDDFYIAIFQRCLTGLSAIVPSVEDLYTSQADRVGRLVRIPKGNK